MPRIAPSAYSTAASRGSVYISGPMRGKPNDNFEAFNGAAAMLKHAGWGLIRNPADKGHLSEEYTWQKAMVVDLQWVMECDTICLLPGWDQSEGARLEISVARALGKKFVEATFHGTIGHPEPEWKWAPIDTPSSDSVEGIDAEARRLVYGARAQTYGHPRGDFAAIAKMWTGILQAHLSEGYEITGDQVALMMAALKLARLAKTPTHHDSQVDTIGYMLCLARLQEDPAEVEAWENR